MGAGFPAGSLRGGSTPPGRTSAGCLSCSFLSAALKRRQRTERRATARVWRAADRAHQIRGVSRGRRPAPHLYAAPGGVRDYPLLTAGSSPACRTSGQGIHGGRPSHDLPALLPTPRAPVTRGKRGQAAASGLTPREPPPTSHTLARTSAAPRHNARVLSACCVFPTRARGRRLLSA